MRTCPECAEKIQDAARVCTHCQADLAVEAEAFEARALAYRRARAWGCLLIMGLGAAIAVWFWIKSPSCTATPEPPLLQVSARYEGFTFSITNHETLDSHVELDLNDEYRTEIDLLQAGETRTVPAIQFATRQGLRFDPIARRPMSLHVSTTVAGQSRWTHLTWK